MDEKIVLECFLNENVLVHTDSDVIGDINEDEDLNDAAWGWAEALENNLLSVLGKGELTDEECEEIYSIFEAYKGDKAGVLLDRISDIYPENIPWYRADLRPYFDRLYDHFLACWRDPAFRRPVSRPGARRHDID